MRRETHMKGEVKRNRNIMRRERHIKEEKEESKQEKRRGQGKADNYLVCIQEWIDMS